MTEELTIILVAYDSYNDVWPGFIKCKQKYWNNCPYKTIMINCNVPKEQLPENVKNGLNDVLCEGLNTQWTERVHTALQKINTPFVLLWLEDLYIDRFIDNDVIINYLNILKNNNDIGHIRLCNDTNFQLDFIDDDSLGEILPNHAYRVSTHPALWKKDYLYQLTEKPMDAWNFEYQAGYFCDKYNLRSLMTKKDVLHFSNMVWRAKWTREAVILNKKENLNLDFSHRKKHSLFSNLKTDIDKIIYKVLGAELVCKIVSKRRMKGKGIPKA